MDDDALEKEVIEISPDKEQIVSTTECKSLLQASSDEKRFSFGADQEGFVSFRHDSGCLAENIIQMKFNEGQSKS